MMPRVKIGDIIEIKTPKGLFYAQYTHKLPKYGQLIQFTRTSFEHRPVDLKEILDCEIGIITFLPINAALREEEFQMIGNAPVPQDRQVFPVFRARGAISKDGKAINWYFWDGYKTWPKKCIENLSETERKLPILVLMGIPTLLACLEWGWKPIEDDYFFMKTVARETPQPDEKKAEQMRDGSGEEQAVLVYLDIQSFPAPMGEVQDVFALEDQLAEVIEQENLGVFDGDEFGPDGVTLYMYGPDAERLYAGIESVLKNFPLCKNAKVVKRYGELGSRESTATL
jgi:hypothetical protein